MLVALILVTALFPITAMSETDENGGIVIEEILVSASSAQYNGTDWNGWDMVLFRPIYHDHQYRNRAG